MQLLHGVSAPTGKGTVLEVHLDIQNALPAFGSWLEQIGFENDPFVVFYPPEYSGHMTGRIDTNYCLDRAVGHHHS